MHLLSVETFLLFSVCWLIQDTDAFLPAISRPDTRPFRAFSASSSSATSMSSDSTAKTTTEEPTHDTLSSGVTAAAGTTPNFRFVTTPPPTQPLSPLTFAGKVEAALIHKYTSRGDDIQRVLESWRWLDQGYEHREYFGPSSSSHTNISSSDHGPNHPSDVTPETSNCYQYAHSYVRGLTVKPFWPTEDIPWAKKLCKQYPQILNEFKRVTKDMDKLVQEGNNIWAGALTEEAGGYGEGWRTLVLKDRGIWDEVNCNLFPKTAKAVEQSGIPATEVFFASMKPHSEIKLHSDFTNFVLTSHLAVDIPDNGKNKCRLTIGDETREWKNGEVMLFDTSLMHDAVNESDGMRYILMFRLWHPDLTQVERDALQFIYDCLSVPELLDDNEEIRTLAEKQMEKLRKFPLIKSSSSVGFGNSQRFSDAKKKKRGKS